MGRWSPCRRSIVAAAVISACIGSVAAVQAAIEGKVTAPSGAPVVLAEITWEAAVASVHTDAAGNFRLPSSASPRVLVVRHPLFTEASVTVVSAETPLSIVLDPAPVFSEAVLVLDRRLTEDAVPHGTSASSAAPGDRPAAPNTLLDVIGATPGVAENGQGGIFQNYSVRGLSRQRVLTLVEGMRIVGERRAGVSASFIDPLLLDGVSIVRGPASIAYGSGALGGVVEVFPRLLAGGDAEAGYLSQGDGTYLGGGWGGNGWSFAAAGRDKGDGEDADGKPIDDGFEQVSATLRRSWSRGGVDYDVLAIPAAGRDIDKASTDAPARVVSYPEEDHLLVRFAARSAGGWRVRAYVHPNDLTTRTEQGGVLTSEVVNDAFDWGAAAQWEWAPGRGPRTRAGLDWFGRRSVDAVESGIAPGQTLDGGLEDEPSVFGTVEWGTRRITLQGGARAAWNRQANSGASVSDFGWNGFLGMVVPLPRRFELATHVATGSRFPSLSERFFSGSTGRGTAVGNASLTPETAVSLEINSSWTGSRLRASISAFHTRVEDFIERVEIAPDVFTFENVREAAIVGLELEAYAQATAEIRVTLTAAHLRGEDGAGAPLEDVPPDRATLGLDWSRGALGVRAEGQWRGAKDDPGAGEKPIPDAWLLSVSSSLALPRGVHIVVAGFNLLDDAYYPSADEKVPLAAGRGFQIGVRWSGGRGGRTPVR